MVDAPRSFIDRVGHVLFPRGPKDLTDVSRCPACFVGLPASSVCLNCGLDLNHPDAPLLREESLNVAALLDARLELIGKIRFETAALINSAVVSSPPAVIDSDVDTGAVADADADAAADVAADAGADGAGAADQGSGKVTPTASPARSHSGIQVLLLVVGVSLLSVGAVFFLIYAFLTFGLIWRSAIIASITIASIVAASKMKQRGLSATAEALSILAVVFVILDIYALRANELLVIGDTEGRMYWGGALLISSVGFMLWHRASNLVLINVVGFLVFPPAAALLVAGIASDRNFESSTLITVAAFAAASLIHLIATHGTYRAIVERVVTAGYAMLALLVGLISGVVEGSFSLNNTVGAWMLVLAAIATVHSFTLRGHGPAAGVRYAYASIAGLLLGAGLWIIIAQSASPSPGAETPPSLILVTVATLAVAALIVEAIGHRLSGLAHRVTRWASVGVWAVTAAAALFPLSTAIVLAAHYVDQQQSRRSTLGSATFDIIERGWPQLALLSIPLAMAVAWGLTDQLRARIHLVLASAGLALALAAPLTGTLARATIAWLVLAIVAVIVIALDRKRRGPRRVQLTIAAGGMLPLLLAYSSGWSSHETWAVTSLTTATLMIAARYLFNHEVGRATLLGTAAVVLIVAAGGVGEHLQFLFTENRPNPLESWLTVALATVAVLALSLWNTAPTLIPAERRTLWWIGLSGTTLAAANLWVASVNGAPAATAPLVLNIHLVSLIVSVASLALLGLSLARNATRERLEQRYVAAALLAPATVWALDSASRAIGFADIAIELAPATASVLVGALSMALRVRGNQPRIRRISEVSALAVAGIAAASAALEPRASHWLIVLLVAITLLLASISRNGIFGAKSPRRHLVWVAVAFATWALWLRLDQTRVDALEAYVLPLAAAVLAIAVFTARAELRHSRLTSAPAIALVALLIAILPLSLNAASGNGLRTLVIAGLCGALLLTASFVEPRDRFVDLWGVAIVASGVGLVVATASRALVLAVDNRSALPELDSWLLGAVAVLALASFGLTATNFTRDPANSRWSVTSEALLGTSIGLLYAVETLVLLDAGSINRPLDGIRIVLLVTLGGALLVVTAARPPSRPLTHRMSYLAFALASIVGAIAYLGNLINPLEWITVPLGIAMLTHGALRMAREAQARSFPSLTPGLLVILVPSLIATFIDTDSTDTQWRILALGIAAVLAIIVGTWLKLQAPLIVGAVVVLIHAAHTFAPVLVTFYQLTDWWVWAVVGGAIVLFLGITLERRIRDLKVLNARFSSLR
ncbi:hypothetical protein A20C1_04641 [marine actinobacterium PHSC20C1]|nr:hypothetical protein A20C1_04641 [marine actinobacterium PHSC20C1]